MAISRHPPRSHHVKVRSVSRERKNGGEAFAHRQYFTASIFDGEPLPDFIDPFFDRVEPRMQGAIVKIENIAEGKKPKNPVMALDIRQYRLDRMADQADRAQ
jgi:hypothetical protein